MMEEANRLKNLFNQISLPALVAFFLPFRKEISFLLCLLGFFYVLLSKERRSSLVLNLKSHKSVYLVGILFVLYLLGLTYSTNFSFGLKDIDTKIPFLLFPLFLLSNNQYNIFRILKYFVVGCLVASVFCLLHALNSFQYSHNSSVFFYDDLSIFMHTSYFSMYLLTSLVFSYFFFQYSLKEKNYRSVFLFAITIFTFLLMIFLLSSKAGVAIAFLIIIILIFHDVFIYKKLLFTSLMIAQVLIFTLTIPSVTKYVFNRFESANEASKSQQQSTSKSNSTASRLVIYKSAFQVFQENKFFGVGTGDIKDELFKKYKLNNFQFGVDHKYNSHNQYLQFLATLGIFGYLVMVITTIILIIKKYIHFNLLFVLFLLIFLINIIVESMFETRAGVEFFTFFFIILNINKINYDSFLSTKN